MGFAVEDSGEESYQHYLNQCAYNEKILDSYLKQAFQVLTKLEKLEGTYGGRYAYPHKFCWGSARGLRRGLWEHWRACEKCVTLVIVSLYQALEETSETVERFLAPSPFGSLREAMGSGIETAGWKTRHSARPRPSCCPSLPLCPEATGEVHWPLQWARMNWWRQHHGGGGRRVREEGGARRSGSSRERRHRRGAGASSHA